MSKSKTSRKLPSGLLARLIMFSPSKKLMLSIARVSLTKESHIRDKLTKSFEGELRGKGVGLPRESIRDFAK